MRSLLLAILGVTLAFPAMAHDPIIPASDSWYESLRVPSDGLALQKGNSCCHKNDCKQRSFSHIAPGVFSVVDEASGNTVLFTEQMRITDPEVLRNNPYFQITTCIWQGHPVCWTEGNAGG